MTRTIVIFAALVCGTVGCNKDEQGGSPAEAEVDRSALDPLTFVALSSLVDDIEKAREQMEKGEDTKYTCVSAGVYIEELERHPDSGVQAKVRAAKELCHRDAPLAWAGLNLDKIEANRKPGEDAPPTLDCVDVEIALEVVREHYPKDERYLAEQARYDSLCK